VPNSLPARPNLDHLRRQAKSLLSALAEGDEAAAEIFREHLPAARGMSARQVRGASFRLADAQSAVARKTGFASWPHLARHVELLRALEGTWSFESLEVDGGTIPASHLSASRLLIDGDRFRTESPEATYEGVFNIDVEADPHWIDIDFVEGPEAGNRNAGIFRLEGDRFELCLDTSGRGRPGEFITSPGTGHARETLVRASNDRPQAVTGGGARKAAAKRPEPNVANRCQPPEGFEYRPSATLTRLQGAWNAVSVVRDGKTLPAAMCSGGRRTAEGNEITIAFGGHVMIHALVRIDEGSAPAHVDHHLLDGAAAGSLQLGIMKWEGADACFCMAAPGQPRPNDFECKPGSGRTLSRWTPTGT